MIVLHKVLWTKFNDYVNDFRDNSVTHLVEEGSLRTLCDRDVPDYTGSTTRAVEYGRSSSKGDCVRCRRLADIRIWVEEAKRRNNKATVTELERLRATTQCVNQAVVILVELFDELNRLPIRDEVPIQRMLVHVSQYVTGLQKMNKRLAVYENKARRARKKLNVLDV